MHVWRLQAYAGRLLRLLKAVQASLQEWGHSANPSLLQLQELLQEAGRLSALPVNRQRSCAVSFSSWLRFVGSAGKLLGAADTAASAASRLADTAAETADAAAASVQRAAGKYRSQLDELIGIAEAALEGWLYVRSKREKLRSSVCSGQGKGNPNEEGSE